MTRSARQRAFTLLELLLVLMVVSVFGALALPRMSGSLKHQRLQDQVRTTIALARKARALAASEGRAYVLVVDGEGRSLRLLRKRDPLAQAEGEDPELEPAEDPAPDWAQPWEFPEGVTLQGVERNEEQEETQEAQIVFLPNGEAEAVRLTFGTGQSQDEQAVVEVLKPLGEARLVDPDAPEATR